MFYQNAKKIVYASKGVSGEGGLLVEKDLQIGLAESDLCILKGRASIILDFGKELSGGARILTYAVSGEKAVRLRFGESVGEACSELKKGSGGEDYGGYGSTNDHSNRDMRVELQGYSDMTFGQTAYRFLRIDTLDDKAEISIKTVVAAIDTDQREALGFFECDDPLVNEIYDTAAYTVRLCIQNGYIWDGVKRDRLVWIGDLYPEVRALHCLFGSIPESKNCLEYAMKYYPLPSAVNHIPTYSLWWLICLEEACRQSGDISSFSGLLPYAKGILEKIIVPAVSKDGSVDYGFNFIDWPTNTRENEEDAERKTYERKAGAAFLTKIAVEALKNTLSAFGEESTLCDAVLARVVSKKYDIDIYKQIAAFGVWSGFDSESIRKTLMRGGANGLSTFLSYQILTSMAHLGEYETALSIMKEYYGGMLSVGATTFWEDFDLAWLEGSGRLDEMPKAGVKDIHGDFGKFCYSSFRHSLCHGWSAGVIPYLFETVAGIRPIGMDMKRIEIKPQLSGLKRLKVKFPTPYGLLEVEHALTENGEVKTSVIAPRQIEVTVLPL